MRLDQIDEGIKNAQSKVSQAQDFVNQVQLNFDNGTVLTPTFIEPNNWTSLKTEEVLAQSKSRLVGLEVNLKNFTNLRTDFQAQLDNFIKNNPQ